jgi:hypothetical protein
VRPAEDSGLGCDPFSFHHNNNTTAATLLKKS